MGIETVVDTSVATAVDGAPQSCLLVMDALVLAELKAKVLGIAIFIE